MVVGVDESSWLEFWVGLMRCGRHRSQVGPPGNLGCQVHQHTVLIEARGC